TTFCVDMVAYRRFMDRLAAEEGRPREIAAEIEREDRLWLASLLDERFGGPPAEALIELLEVSERWTLPADDLLRELVRVIVESVVPRASGEISQETIDEAIEQLRGLRSNPADIADGQ